MISNAQRQFESGDYQAVVKTYGRAKSIGGDEATALICSLAFLGQHAEAVDYWKVHYDKLNEVQRCRSRFALGVALTRVSKLKMGRKFFRNNLAAAKQLKTLYPYAYQGVGFYFYFIGRFGESQKWAKKASVSSLKFKDGFMRFLAVDLLGHCEVQLGRRGEGLRLMRQAAKLASAHGNPNFASSFDVASLIYEAEAGARPLTIENELRESLNILNVQDSYTRGNLLLELARQLTLRGRWDESKQLLGAAASSVYNFSNRRQELNLQMRLGELSFCQGEFFLTEHFIQAAKRCLNVVADKAFEVKLLGLEQKFLKASGSKVPAQLITRLLELSEHHGSHINEQILFRQNLVTNPKIARQDDPLHHLFLKHLRAPEQAANEALELGYLGLWHRFKQLSPGKKYFVVLPDHHRFVLASPNGAYLSTNALSRQQLRILQCLRAGTSSKEELLESVWGYGYDPARHDPLMHSTIAKLRKVIDPGSNWIVTVENGWSLDTSVVWLIPDYAKAKSRVTQDSLPESVTHTGNFIPLPDLNFRQLVALEQLESKGMWSITQYKSHFNVSTMTAFRDLSGLLANHLLIKTGRARATRYHLAQKGSSS